MAGKRTTLEARRSRYFQGIAAAFFRLRGAPFVLSSGEMVTIAGWEQAGIPLDVVLEGVRRAHENSRRARPAPGRLSSLSYCDREVRRAFQEYRDRRVGGTRAPVARSAKAGRAREAVERFLEAGAGETGYLREVYEQALTLLSRKAIREEGLETLEADAERLILEQAGGAERVEAEKQVRADFAGRSAAQYEDILAVELVRRAREKHGIPHLSLFYY
ncbi:MAG: hypothetical protein A2W03_13395 [Candidatus Aminicenantes bacterium RBG_16_63_16]|nr:MAG: hypothetical protein A2W03_13395 [Candidatus Aminicenantes bacterium RBG_16_63_16]